MKNYIKVVLLTKTIDVFTFEDQDEGDVHAALLSAETVAKSCKGRVVAWALTGYVPKSMQTVGRAFDWAPELVS